MKWGRRSRASEEDLGCAVREERVDPNGTDRHSCGLYKEGRGRSEDLRESTERCGGRLRRPDRLSSRSTKVRDLSSRPSFQIAAVSTRVKKLSLKICRHGYVILSYYCCIQGRPVSLPCTSSSFLDLLLARAIA